MDLSELIQKAQEAKEKAYVPYSGFHVGAERTAIFKAVSEGYREFQVIAIISDSKELTSPCGVCRQVMAEFCEPDFEVIMLSCDGKYKAVTLEELLPYAFSLTEEQLATAPELS